MGEPNQNLGMRLDLDRFCLQQSKVLLLLCICDSTAVWGAQQIRRVRIRPLRPGNLGGPRGLNGILLDAHPRVWLSEELSYDVVCQTPVSPEVISSEYERDRQVGGYENRLHG